MNRKRLLIFTVIPFALALFGAWCIGHSFIWGVVSIVAALLIACLFSVFNADLPRFRKASVLGDVMVLYLVSGLLCLPRGVGVSWIENTLVVVEVLLLLDLVIEIPMLMREKAQCCCVEVPRSVLTASIIQEVLVAALFVLSFVLCLISGDVYAGTVAFVFMVCAFVHLIFVLVKRDWALLEMVNRVSLWHYLLVIAFGVFLCQSGDIPYGEIPAYVYALFSAIFILDIFKRICRGRS